MKVTTVLALASVSTAAYAVQHTADSGAVYGFIPPTHLVRSTSPTALPKILPNCTPEDLVCLYFVKSHKVHAEAGADISPSTSMAEAFLDDDLKGVRNLPSVSHIARLEVVPYPYELVIEDYNMTAIHQAIAIRKLLNHNASACATHCNNHRACDAFAIYIESEPSCTNCRNPRMIETNKCDLYNTHLQRPDIRKESSKQDVNGTTMTRSVRAYYGYNRAQKSAITITTRTQTVTISESPQVSFVTRTIHHTVWPECINPATRTVTQPAVTVTKVSTRSTVTVTQTSTQPTTKTETILFTSVKPSTLTKTKTVMFTSVEPSTLIKTHSRTVLFSVTDSTTISETKTQTAMFTKTKPTTLTKTESRTAMFTETKPTTLTKTKNRTAMFTESKPTTLTKTKSRTAMFTETKSTTLTKTESRTAMFTKATPTTVTKTQSRTLVVSTTSSA